MKWSLYSHRDGWLIDDCVGPEWSWNVNEALWFDGEHEIDERLKASDISREPWFTNVRVR